MSINNIVNKRGWVWGWKFKILNILKRLDSLWTVHIAQSLTIWYHEFAVKMWYTNASDHTIFWDFLCWLILLWQRLDFSHFSSLKYHLHQGEEPMNWIHHSIFLWLSSPKQIMCMYQLGRSKAWYLTQFLQ